MFDIELDFEPLRRIPRLAQSNVCDAIVVAEGYVELAVSIEGTTVEADLLLESLEEEGSVVGGGFCFARHEDLSDIVRRKQKLRRGWMAFGWTRYQTTVWSVRPIIFPILD